MRSGLVKIGLGGTVSLILVGVSTPAQAYSLGRWGHPQYRAGVFQKPDPHSKRVLRLHWYTEDGYLEVYRVASNIHRGRDGRRWILVQVPGRPRARYGWVRREALGDIEKSPYQLRILRRAHRAVLHKKKNGRWYLVWKAKIGVGKRATPTPRGVFWIRQRIRNLRGSALYGPWAFGTSAYSKLSDWPGGGVIGIHGTNRPWLLGGDVSHGCIRVGNRAIRALARRVGVGTPVIIR